MRILSRGISGLAFFLAGWLLGTGSALAMDFAKGNQVTLAGGQVITGDWYAAGNRVTVIGRVNRDAFIAARHAELRGEIGQDLNLAVKTAMIHSTIQGNARILARDVRIDSTVAGEALIFAENLTLANQSQVGRDMLAAAYRITLDGTVKGRVTLTADTVYINGTLAGGDVSIRTRHLIVGPQAKFMGGLTYYSPQAMTVSPGAQVPAKPQWIKTEPKSEWGKFFGLPILAFGLLVFRLELFLVLLVAGIVLIALIPASSRRFVQAARDRPWPSLGWGVVTLIGFPIAVAALVVTLVGIPLAVLLFLLFILAALLSQAVGGYLIGILIYGENAKLHPIPAYVVGLLIFSFVKFIPVIGSLAKLAALLLGLGAWWTVKQQALPEKTQP